MDRADSGGVIAGANDLRDTIPVHFIRSPSEVLPFGSVVDHLVKGSAFVVGSLFLFCKNGEIFPDYGSIEMLGQYDLLIGEEPEPGFLYGCDPGIQRVSEFFQPLDMLQDPEELVVQHLNKKHVFRKKIIFLKTK